MTENAYSPLSICGARPTFHSRWRDHEEIMNIVFAWKLWKDFIPVSLWQEELNFNAIEASVNILVKSRELCLAVSSKTTWSISHPQRKIKKKKGAISKGKLCPKQFVQVVSIMKLQIFHTLERTADIHGAQWRQDSSEGPEIATFQLHNNEAFAAKFQGPNDCTPQCRHLWLSFPPKAPIMGGAMNVKLARKLLGSLFDFSAAHGRLW